MTTTVIAAVAEMGGVTAFGVAAWEGDRGPAAAAVKVGAEATPLGGGLFFATVGGGPAPPWRSQRPPHCGQQFLKKNDNSKPQ